MRSTILLLTCLMAVTGCLATPEDLESERLGERDDGLSLAADPVAEKLALGDAFSWGSWESRPAITESAVREGRRFGNSVALAPDTAIVAAPYTDTPSVSMYKRTSTGFELHARRTGVLSDGTGSAVATAGGRFAYGEPSAVVEGVRRGRVIVVQPGWLWGTQTLQEASGGDNFGRALAMTDTTLAIGRFRGASMYTRSSLGVFVKQAGLVEPSVTPYYWSDFGASIAIEGDVAVVGAPEGLRFDVGNVRIGPGRAYVFTRAGSTWTHQATLTGPTREVAGGQPSARFGRSVAIGKGRIVVLSEREFDAIGNELPGAAYVFVNTNGTYALEARLAQEAWLEPSIGFDGTRLALGTSDRVNQRYAAHVYERSRFGWQGTRLAQSSPPRVALTGGDLWVGLPEAPVRMDAWWFRFAGMIQPYRFVTPVLEPLAQ